MPQTQVAVPICWYVFLFCHSICKNSSWNSWLHPRYFTINHVNPILTIEGGSLANHRDCWLQLHPIIHHQQHSTTMFCWQVSNDSKHFHMVLSATLGGKKLHPMVEKKSFAPGLKHLNLSARHRSRPANCACTGKNWLMKMWNDRFFAKFMANTVDIIDIIIDIIWFTSTAIFPKISKDHQTGCFHLQNLTKSTQNEVLLIDGEPIRNSPGDYATSHQVHSIGHNNIGC